MDDDVANRFAAASWEALTPKLLFFADRLICGQQWRGAGVQSGPHTQASGDSFSAEDAVQQAVNKFLIGERTYNQSVTLEQNLYGAVQSIISNWHKRSNRRPVIELPNQTDEENRTLDPIQQSADPTTVKENGAVIAERKLHQKKLLDAFEHSLKGDQELLDLLKAYKEGETTPQEIQKETGIPATRISELKRKLRDRMTKFIRERPTGHQLEDSYVTRTI